MKKTIMMVGGIGAGVLMILVAFTSVVNAQSAGREKLTGIDNLKVPIDRHISQKFLNITGIFGSILLNILTFLMMILLLLINGGGVPI